ncbi:Cyclin-dependent kinase 2 like protein [Plasmodiophora brassicae]|nr:hypothetical protein PBRA_007301 [Plasmodiophora brassicae]
MDSYRKLSKLGEGAHGLVYSAEVLPSNAQYGKMPGIVAIKKIRMRSAAEGISQETIRELKLLQELGHPHIIRVFQVFGHRGNINVVLEQMSTDLEVIINTTSIVLRPGDIKAYMRMLLSAVMHCHRNWTMHRDLKPSNCLISVDGVLKLSDFGLAKIFGSPNAVYSPQACTLWFRAPELLFGATSYGSPSDIWSCGCIFAQLMLRVPLFHGSTELEQLASIFAIMGTPAEADWPGMTALPSYVQFEARTPQPLSSIFPGVHAAALDLLQAMLTFDPAKRITAADALAHEYFKTEPAETPPDQLPRSAPDGTKSTYERDQ